MATALVQGQNEKPNMSSFKAAAAEIESTSRSDENALLIQQFLEFYLDLNGDNITCSQDALIWLLVSVTC